MFSVLLEFVVPMREKDLLAELVVEFIELMICIVLGTGVLYVISVAFEMLPTLDAVWLWIVIGLEIFEYVFELVDVFIYIATLGLFVWSRFRKVER